MSKRHFQVGAIYDAGNVRKTNQDSILVKIGEEPDGEFGIFVVADGIGGLADGGLTSKTITDEFTLWWNKWLTQEFYDNEQPALEIIELELRRLIHFINSKIVGFSRSANIKTGSTLSVLFIYKDRYHIKHIGDSRIYLINDDNLIQLTEDHSLAAQQVRDNLITKAEAINHPDRNILTGCIGASEKIELFESAGIISPSDIFLLCSDGLYNYLDEVEIFRTICNVKNKTFEDAQETASHLLRKVKAGTAGDNISAIIVCPDYGEKKRKMTSRIKELFMGGRGKRV